MAKSLETGRKRVEINRMIKGQLLIAIAKQLIPANPEPCPVNSSCPYAGPGWCTTPAEEREARQQKALEAVEEKCLMAYINTDSPSPWPCACIRPGLPVTIEEALRELEEGDSLV